MVETQEMITISLVIDQGMIEWCLEQKAKYLKHSAYIAQRFSWQYGEIAQEDQKSEDEIDILPEDLVDLPVDDRSVCIDALKRTLIQHYGEGWQVWNDGTREDWVAILDDIVYLVPPHAADGPADRRMCSIVEVPEILRQKCHQNLQRYNPGEQLDEIFTVDLKVPKAPVMAVWPPFDRDPADY